MPAPRPSATLVCSLAASLLAASTALTASFEEAERRFAENAFAEAAESFAEIADAEKDPLQRARALRYLALCRMARAEEGADEALLEALIADPEYPANDWFFMELWQLTNLDGIGDAWDGRLDRLEAALAGHPDLMPFVHHLRAGREDSRGRWEEMPQHIARVEPLCDLLLAGPFDNTGGSGMSIPQPPESGIDTTATMLGVRGRSIEWMRARCSPYGVIDLDLHTGEEPEALVYVATYLRAEAPVRATLHLSGSGALRAWLGEIMILDEPVVRTSPYLLYRIPVDLETGWNRLLVKAGADVEPLQVFLRLTDEEGRPLSLPESAVPPPGVEPITVATVPLPPSGLERYPETYWLRTWTEDPSSLSLADRIWLGRALVAFSFLDEAQTLLRSTGSLHPECAMIDHQLARLLERRGSGDAATEWRSALSKAPELYAAREWWMSRAMDRGEMDVAQEILDGMREEFPTNPQVIALSGLMEVATGNVVGGMEHLRNALETWPGRLSLINVYLEVLSSQNQRAEYEAALERAIEARPEMPELHRMAATAAFNRQDFPTAIEHLEMALAANGPPMIVCAELATTRQMAGRLEDAISACRRGLELAPQSVLLHRLAARVLLQLDRSDEAVTHLERALELDPADSSSRNLLRRLRDQPPLTDYFARESTDALLAEEDDWVGEANAVSLMDQVELIVYPNRAQEYRQHYIVRVLTQGGVAQYRTTSAPTSELLGGEIEIARVRKRDGREVEAEVGFGEIAFPDLEPGDVIELRYTSVSSPPPGLARHFWHENFFQYEIPCRLSRFSLLLPSDVDFELAVHNGELDHETARHGDWVCHQWEAREIPAYDFEVDGPSLYSSCLWLDVSTITSWDMIVQWFESGAQGRLRPSAEITAAVEAIAAEATTDSARIYAADRFVRETIEYEGGQFVDSPTVPRAAAEVLRSRYGDCKDQSALLVSMLGELGIDAHFALANSRYVTTVPYLPSPRFTHAIVVARSADGEEFWIDPTAEDLAFPDIPSSLEGTRALVIDAAKRSPFVTVPEDPPACNGTDSYLTASIDADGTLLLAGDVTFRGEDAAVRRYVMRAMPAQHRATLEAWLAELFPGARVDSLSIRDDGEAAGTVTLSFELRTTATMAEAGNMRILAVPWTVSRAPTDLTGLAERKGPLILGAWKGIYTEEVRLLVPETYASVGEGPDVELSCPAGRFRLSHTLDENGDVVLRRELVFSRIQVDADGYAEFREFLNGTVRAEREQLVFSVGG